MAADITVFDPETVIDRATYESPALPSEGVRFVLVNGEVALEDGVATGARSGRAAVSDRQHAEPARRMRACGRSSAKGTVSGRRVAINLTQRAGAREATGTFTIDGLEPIKRVRRAANPRTGGRASPPSTRRCARLR